MNINNIDYIQILANHKKDSLADHQFLKSYLESFYKIYAHEIAYIKNIDSKYVGATSSFAKLVGVKPLDIIMSTDFQLPCISNHAEFYNNYDKIIWNQKKQMTFLDINEWATGTDMYIFHKKPIINPYSGNVVGIFCYGEKYKNNNLLKTFLDMHRTHHKKHYHIYDTSTTKINLGAIQSEILFCMLLGFKEDKIITQFINNIKNSSYTKVTVNNAMKELFKKFNTNSRDKLIQLAFSENYHLNIPKTFVKYGSYLIDMAPTKLT